MPVFTIDVHVPYWFYCMQTASSFSFALKGRFRFPNLARNNPVILREIFLLLGWNCRECISREITLKWDVFITHLHQLSGVDKGKYKQTRHDFARVRITLRNWFWVSTTGSSNPDTNSHHGTLFSTQIFRPSASMSLLSKYEAVNRVLR